MAVHNVYVFDANGEPIITIKLGNMETDSTLLTGFLSAMETFSKEIAQGEVDEIKIKDYRFHIKQIGSTYIAMVLDKDDKDGRWRLTEVCKVIEKHQRDFTDRLLEKEIKNAATRKITVTDRVTNWAVAGL